MSDKVQTLNDTTASPKQQLNNLRYFEKLTLFDDVIVEKYKAKDIYVYRTTPNNPPTDIDLIPSHRLDKQNQGQEYKFEYTEEEVGRMSYGEKAREVSIEGISAYKTQKKAIREAKRAFNTQLKRFGKEEAEAYKNKRGCYVMCLHIKEGHGLSSDFHKTTGHINILLKNGVKINDVLDFDSELIKFSYDD